jgi:hypothetical protein
VKAPGGGKWWPQVVRGLVVNPVYAGRQADKAGVTILRCEPLVDAATFARAGQAAAGPKRQGPPGKAMLSGAIFCPRCGGDSPMHRMLSGKKSGRIAYYRCAGRGPERKGCGNNVRAAWADAAVCSAAAGTFAAPVMVTTFVPGSDHEAELAEVALELRQLANEHAAERISDEDYQVRFTSLVAERKRLRALPTEPGRWEETPTEQTYYDLWQGLQPAERGPWLREHGFRVHAEKTPNGRVAVTITRTVTREPGKAQVMPWPLQAGDLPEAA